MQYFITTFPFEHNKEVLTGILRYTNISIPFFKACEKIDFSQSSIEETVRYKKKLSKEDT